MIDYTHQPTGDSPKPVVRDKPNFESQFQDLERRVRDQADMIERLKKHINKLETALQQVPRK